MPSNTPPILTSIAKSVANKFKSRPRHPTDYSPTPQIGKPVKNAINRLSHNLGLSVRLTGGKSRRNNKSRHNNKSRRNNRK